MAQKRAKPAQRDPVVVRATAALERAYRVAFEADSRGAAPGPNWGAESEAAQAAMFDAKDDRDAAQKCVTLADLLACPRLAVRDAALLAVAPIPPAPPRLRGRRDPATATLKRLKDVLDECRKAMDASKGAWPSDPAGHAAAHALWTSTSQVWHIANEAHAAAGCAVAGLTDPQDRMAALLACPDATVHETALLALEPPAPKRKRTP